MTGILTRADEYGFNHVPKVMNFRSSSRIQFWATSSSGEANLRWASVIGDIFFFFSTQSIGTILRRTRGVPI